MTDDEMLTAVRDRLTAARDAHDGVRMRHPAEAIRAQAAQRRRRRGLAAAATMAAAVVLAVVALLTLGGPAPARLAAWTVATRPGGQVTVTIRQLRDPAGLQRRLRADGVPATVRFTGQNPPACQYYPLPSGRAFRLMDKIFAGSTPSGPRTTAFTISTRAIPPRIGLWITVSPLQDQAGYGRSVRIYQASWTLVYASGRCSPHAGPDSGSGEGVVGSPG